jgi:hypothetical protein
MISTWIIENVDKGGFDDVGWYTSIALDSNDYPHISYYNNGAGDLKYAVAVPEYQEVIFPIIVIIAVSVLIRRKKRGWPLD